MIQCNPGPAMQIEGWMEPEELLWLAATATTRKDICEIGSWMGRSTRALVDNTVGTVTAVDTWKGTSGIDLAKTSDPEGLFQIFKNNMAGRLNRLYIQRSTSIEAAAAFKMEGKTFDFIFIDANHEYESVKADIQAWFPLLRQGGIISGHDYIYIWPGVVRAVNECFPNHQMVAKTIWVDTKI